MWLWIKCEFLRFHNNAKKKKEKKSVDDRHFFRLQKWLLNYLAQTCHVLLSGGLCLNCVCLITCWISKVRPIADMANTLWGNHTFYLLNNSLHSRDSVKVMVLEHNPLWTVGQRNKNCLDVQLWDKILRRVEWRVNIEILNIEISTAFGGGNFLFSIGLLFMIKKQTKAEPAQGIC